MKLFLYPCSLEAVKVEKNILLFFLKTASFTDTQQVRSGDIFISERRNYLRANIYINTKELRRMSVAPLTLK